MDPVVQRLIAANPGLNFNLGFFFFCPKAFSQIIFSLLFTASNHQIVGKKIELLELNLLLKLSYLKSNFVLSLGELSPALNNSAMINKIYLLVTELLVIQFVLKSYS